MRFQMKLRILSFCVVTTLLTTCHTDILTSQSAMIPHTQIRPSILRSIGSALWRTTRTITSGSPQLFTAFKKSPKLSFVAMTLTGIASYLWWRSHPQQLAKPGQPAATAAPQPTGTEPKFVVPSQEAAAASQAQSTPAPQRISTKGILDEANFNIPQLDKELSKWNAAWRSYDCSKETWGCIKEVVAKSLLQAPAAVSSIGTDEQIYSFLQTIYSKDLTQKNLAYIKYIYEAKDMETNGADANTIACHKMGYQLSRTKPSEKKAPAQPSSSQTLQFNSEAPQQ